MSTQSVNNDIQTLVASKNRRRALETVRAEDYIEYYLFPDVAQTPNANASSSSTEAVADILEQTARRVTEIASQFAAKYIWHKDCFRVTTRFGDTNLLPETVDDNDAHRSAVPLPAHLYGITYFDDNIQDEWFIVALLFELTRRVNGLIARATDADGEFVLIEAAEHLPEWANPETCAEKIFIASGNLHLVHTNPALPQPDASTNTIAASVAVLRANPTAHRMSAAVHQTIAARLVDFPNNLATSQHYANVYVPLPAAALLDARPQLVAAAVRAFCQRDPVDMRACRAMRHFPPECRVRTGVRFTRYQYAQLVHSAYVPDRRTGWNMPPVGHAQHAEHSIGVKIACGFEILAAQARPEETDTNDADTMLTNDRQWLEYLQALHGRGYFQGLLAGSQGYERLLASAKEFYRTHVARTTTFGTESGAEIVRLLKQLDASEEEFREREAKLPPSDNEDWLNVSPEELDAMLAARYGIRKTISGDGAISAADLTGNITEFLDQKSEWDGVQVAASSTKLTKASGNKKNVQFEDGDPTSHENSLNTSTTVDFNPDDFQRHVKEMLDLVIPEDDWESQSDMSDFESDEGLEANIDRMANGKSMQSYMDEMDAELSRTTIGKSFEKKDAACKSGNGDDAEDVDFDDIENFKPVDIDVNTLKNMAHSYRSQFGGPGPASSLLGSMGLRVRPEEDTDDAEAKMYDTQV